MRRLRDRSAILAILDAFAFFVVITCLCASLPLFFHTGSQTVDFMEKVEGIHQALLGSNTTLMDGGAADLPLWRYIEMCLASRDEERMAAIDARVTELLQRMASRNAWEWSISPGNILLAEGQMSGDLYCSRVRTPSGTEFQLRIAPSGVLP
jgi:hypothetical protein